MTDTAILGRADLRREDRRLLTGQGRYLDDIKVHGALHVCFVRSPYAHARINGIDTSAALKAEGVVGVFTGTDLAKWTTPLRMAPGIEGVLPVEAATLPIDKVLFIGDPVAVVVATDRYLAEDAAALIEIDYDALDAVASYEAAVGEGAPDLYDTVPGNIVSRQVFAGGEPDAILSSADIIVEARFSQNRVTHAPMETRGCIAEWDEGQERLTFRVGNQAPHPLRSQLARRLMLDESQVRVVCPDIGGAFGQKIALMREELTVAALSRHLKRPVRWQEDRMENLLAAGHARQETCETKAAVSPDGHILALTLNMEVDFGAYCFYPANYMARVVAMILTGPYRISNYGYEVKVALTNKCGSGPMRAPMAIASWVMDGTIEAIARELKLDPVEVRRVNMLTDADLPYNMQTGEVLHDITPAKCLDAVLGEVDYEGFRKRQDEDRARGIYRGLGLCNVVEPTTYGSAFYKAAAIPGSGHEAGWVKVEPTGAVNASCGLMGSGHGYETVFAQVVAEGLGVEAETVRIHMGDTDVAPYGMGTRGARGGTAGGGVLLLAAQAVRAKALKIAAAMLNLNTADELKMLGGKVLRTLDGEWQDTGLTLQKIASVAYLDPLALPQGVEPGLEAHRAYDPPAMTYSNASHACEVIVDVRTGKVTVERHTVAEDCGRVMNPLIVQGQQHGAIAMGLSGALLEEVVYDEDGQNITGSFADYSIATAVEIPPMHLVHVGEPTLRTPTGSKGMSEGGIMGSIGAVTNAVNDALAPFGEVADTLPLSPQYIRSLLRGIA